MLFPFCPQAEATNSLAVTSTGATSVQVSPISPKTVRVVNIAATTKAFISFGTSSVTANTSTGLPIRGNTDLLLSTNGVDTWIAAITTAGTATLYVTPGAGL